MSRVKRKLFFCICENKVAEQLTGTRSKIFNEIVFEDNHLLRLHEKCIYITIKREMVMQLNFTHLPKFV